MNILKNKTLNLSENIYDRLTGNDAEIYDPFLPEDVSASMFDRETGLIYLNPEGDPQWYEIQIRPVENPLDE